MDAAIDETCGEADVAPEVGAAFRNLMVNGLSTCTIRFGFQLPDAGPVGLFETQAVGAIETGTSMEFESTLTVTVQQKLPRITAAWALNPIDENRNAQLVVAVDTLIATTAFVV